MCPRRLLLPLLAAMLLSCSPALLAVEGLSPVLTLNPGESRLYTAAELGFPETSGVRVRTAEQSGLKATEEGTGVRLVCDRPFGWQVLETDAGDLLLRSGGRVLAEIRYRGEPGQTVDVFGSFNGWSRGANLLAESAPGEYTTRLLLEPGDYEYLLRIGEREFLDPANPDSVGNGMGGFNSPLRLRAPKGGTIGLRRLGWKEGHSGRSVRFLCEGQGQGARVLAMHGNRRLPEPAATFSGDTLEIRLGTVAQGPDVLRLALAAEGRASALQTLRFDGHFTWEDGLVYALMPDRFRDGDPSNNDPVFHPELAAGPTGRAGTWRASWPPCGRATSTGWASTRCGSTR
jgi:hypothetical protein